MAVRPWENRFLDSNLRDEAKIGENNMVESENVHKTQMKSASKKANTSNLISGVSKQKTDPSQSDGNSSPGISSSIPVLSKARSKPAKDDLSVEVNSRPGAGSRSHSNPKERSREPDRSTKERLSLPSSGQISFSLSLRLRNLLSFFLFYNTETSLIKMLILIGESVCIGHKDTNPQFRNLDSSSSKQLNMEPVTIK